MWIGFTRLMLKMRSKKFGPFYISFGLQARGSTFFLKKNK